MFKTALTIAAMVLALPAAADGFSPVRDKGTFLSIVQGRTLDLDSFLFNVVLSVRSNGTIAGSAVGSDVSGSWQWIDGYFCRDMQWGSRALGYNCQLVETTAGKIRFTEDQGAGRAADFRLN